MSKQAVSEKRPNPASPDMIKALSEHHEEFLGFLSKRMGSLDDAKDVLQDFCIRAISKQGQLRNKESLVSWLYALLRSTLADHYRKTGRQQQLKQSYSKELDSSPQTATIDEFYDTFCKCLHTLLPALPPDQGLLLKKLDLESGDRKAMARELGISSGALSVRLYRSRQALRQALFTSCTGCIKHGFDDCA
jgi:RNA polymerase sigma factor (sigma-70 family)